MLTPDDATHFERLLGGDSEALQQMAQMPDPCTEPAAREWIEARIGPGGHHLDGIGARFLDDVEADGARAIEVAPVVEVGLTVGNGGDVGEREAAGVDREAPDLLEAPELVHDPERQAYIGRIRDLSRLVAQAYVDSRAALGFPMLPDAYRKIAA